MQEVLLIDQVEQAAALLKPLRIEILRRLAEPHTCTDLGVELGETPQKIYYHVKVLERAGLLQKVDERRVGGIMEGLYQATAASYWLAPELVGEIGGTRQASDQFSLGYLLGLAEQLQTEVGRLASHPGEDIPSLGLSATIHLPDGDRREAFMRDLQTAIQDLAAKYGLAEESEHQTGDFRLIVACYPSDPLPSSTTASATKKTGDENNG